MESSIVRLPGMIFSIKFHGQGRMTSAVRPLEPYDQGRTPGPYGQGRTASAVRQEGNFGMVFSIVGLSDMDSPL